MAPVGARRTRSQVVALVVGATLLFTAGAAAVWWAMRGFAAPESARTEMPKKTEVPKKTSPSPPCADGDVDGCRARCREGERVSCTRLGEAYERGTRVKRDYAVAVEAYRKACDRGDPRGCSRLGGLILSARGASYDHREGVAVVRKACDGGYSFSCAWLALQGEGEPKDAEKARALFARACEDEDRRACTWQGEMSLNGLGGARDASAAERLFRRGCDGGEQWSCWRLSQRLRADGGAARAKEADRLLREACDADVDGACVDLGGAPTSP
jgi:hypothetical protein